MTGLRLAYYGDDFSGSTDVLEVLALAGLPTRLFLDPPTPEAAAGLGAVGVAGVSRSLPTDQMDAALRPVLMRLKSLGAPLVHYKVCSTFDSSPAIGSIGKAIDIGAELFGGPCIPVVVGAPALGRYVSFGNLFARSGQDSPVYRLDRHPSMSRHPVTPMHESDLRLILGEQTQRSVQLIDTVLLDRWRARSVDSAMEDLLRNDDADESPGVLLFDTLGEHQLEQIGRTVWKLAVMSPPLFAVGSSGLEYALAAHWTEAGELPSPPEYRAPPGDQLLVVSGSCSPVTARQITWALDHGFCEVAVSPQSWLEDNPCAERTVETVLKQLVAGRSVVLHSSLGPDDARTELVRRSGVTDTGQRLGRFLGTLLNRILSTIPIKRLCVAGGDTSGFVARELGMDSLEFLAPIAPGSPLCRIHAPGRPANGHEIVFKGGQVGKVDCLDLIRTGRRQV